MATKRTSAVTEESVVTIDLQNFLVPISIFLSSVIIALSIFLAGRVIANSIDPDSVKSNDSNEDSGTGDTGNGAVPTATPAPTTATVSIDDDPILGNPDAKVAIIEFSDYECPYCKRHWQETHPQILENFINSGEVMLVFRDFPLTFHDPAATKEAYAAECTREQGNDETYYKMHDKIFGTTAGNGTGLTDDKLKVLAGEVGINGNTLIDCINSAKYKDEVQKDLADGSAAGINGTPGFVIGKVGSDGKVTGIIVSGAQPYATFESVINDQLGK